MIHTVVDRLFTVFTSPIKITAAFIAVPVAITSGTILAWIRMTWIVKVFTIFTAEVGLTFACELFCIVVALQ